MKYLIGILVFVALVLAGYVATLSNEAKTPTDNVESTEGADSVSTPTGASHSVVLTPDGYEPNVITVKKGDTIVFSTSDDYGKLHWPASNLHPSHGIYPAFDPKKPVEPNADWEFLFDEVGEWRFHDHLAPYHTGTITVE